MSNSLAEHVVEVLILLGFMTGLFIALTKWIAGRTIQKVDEHDNELKKLWQKIYNLELALSKLENRIVEEFADTKTNYKDRFDNMKDIINSHHEESLVAISEIASNIKEQKQFCYLIQEQKRTEHL